MEVVAQQSSRENLEQAFEIAESLGVTRLLDAEGTVTLAFYLSLVFIHSAYENYCLLSSICL